MMSKSPNIGLTLTPASDKSKTFIKFRTELAGEDSGSNMMIIDSEIAALKDAINNISLQPFTWGMLKNGFGENSSS